MKLYYAPGACSLSPHIIAREAGVVFDLEKVDLKTHTTQSGADYYAVNPKGPVPALELDSGEILTEGAAIVQYLSDHAPAAALTPAIGSIERYRVLSWLTYISSELHKAFGPLFNPAITDEARASTEEAISKKIAYMDVALSASPYLGSSSFTIADAYAYAVLRWLPMAHIDVATYPAVADYMKRITERPAVQEALAAEGLI